MSFEVCPQCHSDGSACDLCGIRPMSEKSIAAAMELARMKLLAAERAEPMVPLRLVDDISDQWDRLFNVEDRVLSELSDSQYVECCQMSAAIRAARDASTAAPQLTDYDAGLLNDYGGGNVDWWHTYLRSEIERANEHWRNQIGRPRP